MHPTHSSPLEQSIMRLHTGNTENKEWFYGTVVSILENNNIPYFTKTDRIANAMNGIDVRIDYIKEQSKLLQHMKKQLELSRIKAKEQIAKALENFGVNKLEGVQVSSITITPASQSSKTQLKIIDKDALIKGGFFTVVVDEKAVVEAHYSADQRHEVEAYVETIIETKEKPSSIRINKRRLLATEPTEIEAA